MEYLKVPWVVFPYRPHLSKSKNSHDELAPLTCRESGWEAKGRFGRMQPPPPPRLLSACLMTTFFWQHCLLTNDLCLFLLQMGPQHSALLVMKHLRQHLFCQSELCLTHRPTSFLTPPIDNARGLEVWNQWGHSSHGLLGYLVEFPKRLCSQSHCLWVDSKNAIFLNITLL